MRVDVNALSNRKLGGRLLDVGLIIFGGRGNAARVHDVPTTRFQTLTISTISGIDRKRYFKLRLAMHRQFNETTKLVSLLAKLPTPKLNGAKRPSPCRNGRELPKSKRHLLDERPSFEHDGLTCWQPADVTCRNATVRLANVFANGEE